VIAAKQTGVKNYIVQAVQRADAAEQDPVGVCGRRAAAASGVG
jgi:hypothetical protein